MPARAIDNDQVEIDLHSTGDSAVAGLPLKPGDSDPFWVIMLGPAGFSPTQARVLINAVPVHPDCDPTAAFVWINADGTGAEWDATYIFRNIIDLSNIAPLQCSIHLTVSAIGATPLVVAVNGYKIAPDHLPEPEESSPQDLLGVNYSILPERLKRGLNTVDIMVRLNPCDSLGTPSGGLSVKYSPCSGEYAPTEPSHRLLSATASTAMSGSVVARIPNPPSSSRLFQDLAVPLPIAIDPEFAAISAQIVTLDPIENLLLPVGAISVYGANTDPPAMLTVRVLGVSRAKQLVYLRIWCHPAQSYSQPNSTGNVTEAIALGRISHPVPGLGDPTPWPAGSGVVVVVTNTGGGPIYS